jgi:hypothetical protein
MNIYVYIYVCVCVCVNIYMDSNAHVCVCIYVIYSHILKLYHFLTQKNKSDIYKSV